MAETIDQIRSSVVALQDEIRSLTEIEEITPEDDERLNSALDEFETRAAELKALEDRAERIAAAKAATTERSEGFHAPQVMHRVDPTEIRDIRGLSNQELRDNAMATIEKEGKRLKPRQLDHIDLTVRSSTIDTNGAEIAKRILLTETPAYRSAFAKGVLDPHPRWNAEESHALDEFRAMSEGTTTAGGFGVPVLIDPSIILTAQVEGAPVLDLARIITITTSAWKGVTSAGSTWSYDAEGAEVSDDSPVLAQPSIPVYMARGFIPFSIEVSEDYPGFAEEMSRLLASGYIDLVASQTITGSGSSSPTGVFTAVLAGGATKQVITTTDGVFGAVDIQNLDKAVPERFRSKSTFIMHTQVENQIRAFPTSSNYGYFTVDLSKDGIGMLQGRPVRTSDYAPTYSGTTGQASIAVLGDFSNFVVAQRAGMNVELVPHLLATANNLPNGQRGWFAYARHGFDCATTNAFRILCNT